MNHMLYHMFAQCMGSWADEITTKCTSLRHKSKYFSSNYRRSMWYLTHTLHWLVFRTHPEKCLSVCHLNLDESHESPHTKRIIKIPKARTSWWSGSASPVAGISCAYPCHMGGHCTLNPSRSPLSSANIVCKHKGWMISLASSSVCLAPNTSEEVQYITVVADIFSLWPFLRIKSPPWLSLWTNMNQCSPSWLVATSCASSGWKNNLSTLQTIQPARTMASSFCLIVFSVSFWLFKTSSFNQPSCIPALMLSPFFSVSFWLFKTSSFNQPSCSLATLRSRENPSAPRPPGQCHRSFRSTWASHAAGDASWCLHFLGHK